MRRLLGTKSPQAPLAPGARSRRPRSVSTIFGTLSATAAATPQQTTAMEPDAEDEVLRGELDPAKARLRPYILALERLQAWRNNVPLFYDTMVQDRYAVPW